MKKDLRSFLREIDDRLVRIRKPVDPKRDIGGLCQKIEQPLLFDNVKGYPGWRVVDRLLATREYIALAAGVPHGQLVPQLAARWLKPPVHPAVVVPNAPVRENIFTGSSATLDMLPIAVSSPGDSGPFISGGHLVSMHPETGDHNAAFCRAEVKGPDMLSFGIYRPDTLRNIAAYRERGHTTMPVAVVVGHHPAYDMSAAASLHHPGFSEHEMAGNLLDEAVELTECETVPLKVPASAEVVIEAHLDLTRFDPNGPFGEYTVHYGYDAKGFAATVTGMMMRSGAIYRHLNATRFTDHQTLTGTAHAVQIYTDLQRKGHLVYDVTYPSYGSRLLLVIKATPRYDGEVRDMFLTACARNAIATIVVVVDDDVDIDDPRDIFHALATNVDPIGGVMQIDGLPSNRLTPRARNKLSPFTCVSGKMLLDATRGSTLGQPELRHELARVPFWPDVDPKDFL